MLSGFSVSSLGGCGTGLSIFFLFRLPMVRSSLHFGFLYSFLCYDNILIWMQSSLDLSREPSCFYGDHSYISSQLPCIDFSWSKAQITEGTAYSCQKALYPAHIFLLYFFLPSYTLSFSMKIPKLVHSPKFSQSILLVRKWLTSYDAIALF